MKNRKLAILIGILCLLFVAGCGQVILTADDVPNLDAEDVWQKYEDSFDVEVDDGVDENIDVDVEVEVDADVDVDVDVDIDENDEVDDTSSGIDRVSNDDFISTSVQTTAEELAAYQLVVSKYLAGEIDSNLSNTQAITAGSGTGVKMQIALTFDDGPYTEMTEKYLEILDEYNVTATFFLQGTYIYKRPEYAQMIVDAGHEVGNHSWYHHDLTTKDDDFIDQDFAKSQAIFEEVLGVTPVLYRPAYGAYNSDVVSIAEAYGEITVTWNVDTEDWKETDLEALYEHIMKYGQSGAIILMHENKEITLEVLPMIIEDLQAKGYEFITVSEMIARSMVNWEEEVAIAMAELAGESKDVDIEVETNNLDIAEETENLVEEPSVEIDNMENINENAGTEQDIEVKTE